MTTKEHQELRRLSRQWAQGRPMTEKAMLRCMELHRKQEAELAAWETSVPLDEASQERRDNWKL